MIFYWRKHLKHKTCVNSAQYENFTYKITREKHGSRTLNERHMEQDSNLTC